jgi:hypothetical protein
MRTIDNFLRKAGKQIASCPDRINAELNANMPDQTLLDPTTGRSLPIFAHADVVVAGGGPGGVGAAIAAARTGAKTIIVERFGCFGGTWTSGLLSAIMPWPFVRGIFAEIARRLNEAGAWIYWKEMDISQLGHPGDRATWDEALGCGAMYDAETAKIVLDQMIIEAGVRPLFFAQLVGVVREGERISAIIIESKEGRFAITGSWFIDSSGDGDLAAMAGVPFEMGRALDGTVQPMTMIFKMTGVDDERVQAHLVASPSFEKEMKAAHARGELNLVNLGVNIRRCPRKGEWAFNSVRVIGKNGTKLQDVTDAMIEGRRQVMETVRFVRKHIPGFENATLSETADHIGVRETRRIVCDYTITADDILQVPSFDDAIARGDWYVDIHNPVGGGTQHIHPPAGKFYEIPYRSIRARGMNNLLVASRCIDCTHEAHAAIRVTSQIVAIGEGAGTAAGLCSKLGLRSTRDLDATKLRETLRAGGAFV